jgi:DNA polymerase
MVGSSGVLLRNALKNLVGLDPVADVFYTNVIKCRPDEVDKIGARELTVCRKWLDREMNEVKSPMILVAGDKARQVMLPNLDKPLGKIHGKVFRDEFRNLTMMVTWNPATVEQFIVDPSGARIVMEGSLPWMFTQDMKKLKRLLEDQCGTK